MATADDRVVVRMYRGVLGDCFLITVWRSGKPRIAMIDCGVLQNVRPGQVMVGADGLPADVIEFVGRDKLEKIEGTKPAVRSISADIAEYIEANGGELELAVITHDHYDHVAGFTLADEENVFLKPSFPIRKLWLSWVENTDDPQSRDLARRFAKGKQAVALAAAVGRQAMGDMSDALEQVQALAEFIGPVDAPGLPAVPSHTKTTTQAIQAMRGKVGVRTRYLEPGQVLPPDEGFGLKAYVLAPPRAEARLLKDLPTGKGEAREVYLTDLDEAATVASAALSQLHGMAARGEGKRSAPEKEAALAGATALDPVPFARPHYRRYPPAKGDKPRPESKGWAKLRDAYEAADNRSLSHDWTEAADSLALKLDSDTNNTSLVLAFELPDGRVLLFPGDAQIGNWESWGDQLYPAKPVNGEEQETIEDILRRVVFYKVGHHASHNATARARGLELMTDPRLCAAIPVVEAVAQIQGPGRKEREKGWKMPYADLYQRLKEKTAQRIVRGDGDPSQERDAFAATDVGVHVRHEDPVSGGRWVELTFPLTLPG